MRRRVISLMAAAIWPALLVGCQTGTNGQAGATPGGGKIIDPPPRQVDWTEARYSDADKQARVYQALLNNQRVFVCTRETLELAAGAQIGTDGTGGILRSKLTELGYKVIASPATLSFRPDEREQDAFRDTNACNLVFLLESGARKVNETHGSHYFQGWAKGQVLNLTTHQYVAVRQFPQPGDSQRGKSGFNEENAARAAAASMVDQAVSYLTDEAFRRWQEACLVRTTLAVGGLDEADDALNLREQLALIDGVYYVSLEDWTEASERATYEVLCRFDARRRLQSALSGAREIDVTRIARSGEEIATELD